MSNQEKLLVIKNKHFLYATEFWIKKKPNELLSKSLVVILVILFLWLIINRAWLSDDAYITLRTVDNLIRGNGLVWNVGERVQSYTHPLWMFLLSSIYFFTHEAYFTTLILSITISVTSVIVLVFFYARSTITGMAGVFLLAMSGAFLDYSTSGLENPLTHLLLLIFVYIYYKESESTLWVFYLTLIASLLMVNRMDTILLVIPSLAYAFWQKRSIKTLYQICLGLVPLVVWEFFSIIYYGFPFPNTAYAKLNTTIPSLSLAHQGVFYFKYTLLNDPWTLIIIISGICSITLSKHKTHSIYLAIGVLFYLLYIIKIGGDFMGGRFFTAPLVIAVILLISIDKIFDKWGSLYVIILLEVFLGFIADISPWKSYNSNYDFDDQLIKFSGVVDERNFYYPTTGLLSGQPLSSLPNHPWRYEGVNLGQGGLDIVVTGNVGFTGYYAGPKVYIVDQNALCDPFLARLPFSPNGEWRIGHFTRKIPAGYIESLTSGENSFVNSQQSVYYSKSHLITRGKILGVDRMIAIIKFNLGFNNYLLR